MSTSERSRKTLDLDQTSAGDISPQERAVYGEFQEYTRAICEVVFAEVAAKLQASLVAFESTVDMMRERFQHDTEAASLAHDRKLADGIARTAEATREAQREIDTAKRNWDQAIDQSLERFGATAFLEELAQHRQVMQAAVDELARQSSAQAARIATIEQIMRDTSADLALRSKLTLVCAAFAVVACAALVVAMLRP
jgi:hypothetical protein